MQSRILPQQALQHWWWPERRRALAVPDWRSHPLGSACYPKTNQPATASRGTTATATSSTGAGSFPVLSVGFSSVMEHKARHVFLVPHARIRHKYRVGGSKSNLQQATLHWSQEKCSLNLLSDRNGWAGWQFSVCPQRGHWYRLLWPVARPPRRRAIFFCWVHEGLLRTSSFKGLSKGTGRGAKTSAVSIRC